MVSATNSVFAHYICNFPLLISQFCGWFFFIHTVWVRRSDIKGWTRRESLWRPQWLDRLIAILSLTTSQMSAQVSSQERMRPQRMLRLLLCWFSVRSAFKQHKGHIQNKSQTWKDSATFPAQGFIQLSGVSLSMWIKEATSS